MDWEAWHAAIHGVAKSWTLLSVLVWERLTLASEWGRRAGRVAAAGRGDREGGPGDSLAGRERGQGGTTGWEQLVIYGTNKHNGAVLQFPSRCI